MVSKRHEGGMSGLDKGLHQFPPTKHASKPPISGHKQGLCTCTQARPCTCSSIADTHDSHSIAPAHATMHDMHARADYARKGRLCTHRGNNTYTGKDRRKGKVRPPGLRAWSGAKAGKTGVGYIIVK